MVDAGFALASRAILKAKSGMCLRCGHGLTTTTSAPTLLQALSLPGLRSGGWIVVVRTLPGSERYQVGAGNRVVANCLRRRKVRVSNGGREHAAAQLEHATPY
jgi:hypothetical protein